MNRVEIMGGKVLDLEAKRILNQGREEGRKEGREEGREEGRKEGRKEGREEGLIQGSIQVFRNEMGLDDASIAEKIMKRFKLTRKEAEAYLVQADPA